VLYQNSIKKPALTAGFFEIIFLCGDTDYENNYISLNNLERIIIKCFFLLKRFDGGTLFFYFFLTGVRDPPKEGLFCGVWPRCVRVCVSRM
jgi:hypothetical protein